MNKEKDEKIITNPDGPIFKLAQKILSETTFPVGVENPLKEHHNQNSVLVIEIKISVKKEIPDGRD